MTPDAASTLVGHATDDATQEAFDLAEIRSIDAVLEQVRSRALDRPGLAPDPALQLLSALAEDVDGPGCGGTAGAATGPRPPARTPAPPDLARPRPGAAGSPAAGPGRAAADWGRAVAAAAVIGTVAGAATTTGIVVTGLLIRLTRQVAVPIRGVPRRTWH